MRVLRTPDARFEDLTDWNFAPRYRTIVADDGVELRYHFVDEGPREAAPVLLLHGNPSWSYLHRHMITGLVASKPGAYRRLQAEISGAAGQPHVMIEGANHFIQEDAPDDLVRIIDELVSSRS